MGGVKVWDRTWKCESHAKNKMVGNRVVVLRQMSWLYLTFRANKLNLLPPYFALFFLSDEDYTELNIKLALSHCSYMFYCGIQMHIDFKNYRE